MKEPCTSLPRKIVRKCVCFSGAIFCDRVGCNPAPFGMELVDQVDQVFPSKPASKVQMLEEGFDITLYSIKGEGCDRLLLAELSIFLIETQGKVSPMCLCNDIVSTDRQGLCLPIK